MGTRAAKSLSKSDLKALTERLRDRVEGGYGVLGFSPGPLYKSRLGSHVCNLESGGLCVRVDSRREVSIRARLILGYRVRAISVALSIKEISRYLLKPLNLRLKRIEVIVESVRLAD